MKVARKGDCKPHGRNIEKTSPAMALHPLSRI